MMEELIPVNIVIADRSYRLKIEPADEEMVRKTSSLINDKISEFKTNFAGKEFANLVPYCKELYGHNHRLCKGGG